MRNILLKEIKLSSLSLSFIFILFGLMFFLAGYPVLCGAFFVTLGIFQSFQYARENNDIFLSALLPLSRHDIVKGKYMFVCLIELCSIVIMLIAVIVRMTLLADSVVYRTNSLMNANGFALFLAFIIFGLFNMIFVNGFFTTGYKIGKPFVIHIIVTFAVIGAGEAMHYFPGFGCLNSFGIDCLLLQVLFIIAGAITFIILTFLSCRNSCRKFEKLDL